MGERNTADQRLVLVERDARGVATVTLNDAKRFNALGQEMLAALQQVLDTLAQDAQLRVVVLAGSGKAFCAGHNLKEMSAHPELAWYQQLFAQCSRVMLSIQNLPVPVIARVHGMATAAGCQLVLCGGGSGLPGRGVHLSAVCVSGRGRGVHGAHCPGAEKRLCPGRSHEGRA